MTPEELKKIARDDRAYRYACQLLSDGRIKNLRVEGEHSFSATVEDPPCSYTTSVAFSGGELTACSCTCGVPVASRRVCAHVGALCLELSREGRTQVLLSRARREAGLDVLRWFETPAAREQSLKLLATVEIPVSGPAAGLLSLRVGQRRMYVVQDLSSFVKSYAAGEEIPFGKGLTVEAQWQCFGPAQERLLAYLREIVAARELTLGRPVLRERQLPLTNEQLRRALQLLAQSVFQLTVRGETSTIRGIQAANVPAAFTLRAVGKELELESRLPPECVKLTREGQFVLMEGRVLGLSAAQQHALIPFLCKEGVSRCRFSLPEGEFMVRYPYQLTATERQRVCIARAFAADPEILLMDDPFAALEPAQRGQMQDELVTLQALMRRTMVFITSSIEEAIRIADRLCIMERGRVLQYDKPEEILRSPQEGFVERFVGRNRIFSRPQEIRASDIMITSPVTTHPEVPMLKGMEKMRLARVDSLLVVDEDGYFLGIVRAEHVHRCDSKEEAIKSVMREAKAVASPDETVPELLAKIRRFRVNAVPVVENDKLVGLITNSSIVTILSQQSMELEEVEPL